MAWIPLYIIDQDVDLIRDWLNSDSEIAYIVPTGNPVRDHGWKAVARVDQLIDGSHTLWHIPSGPLPLLGAEATEPDSVVADPWSGWTDRRPGAIPTLPFFGTHPGTIRFELHQAGIEFEGRRTRPWSSLGRSSDVIGMSCFGWVGNRYRPIGTPAATATEQWWRKLRRQVAAISVKISRADANPRLKPEIYAFPCAYEIILQGKMRDDNCH